MSHDDSRMLEHYRQHATERPSAQLDQRILAAAHAACRRPSGWQRLGQWLAGGGQPRWPMALAGLACVGVALGLAWRTVEQPEAIADAPAMQHLRSIAPPAAAPLMERQQERAASADAARAQASAKAKRQLDPDAQLRQVAALRNAGRQAEAQRLLDELRQHHPERDLEKELKALEQAPRKQAPQTPARQGKNPASEPDNARKLDLSLPKEVLDAGPRESAEETSLLPDLFAKPPAKSAYQISGKLLTNEQSEDYLESVEGAEIKLELKH